VLIPSTTSPVGPPNVGIRFDITELWLKKLQPSKPYLCPKHEELSDVNTVIWT